MSPLKPMIMKMPSQCLGDGVGGRWVGSACGSDNNTGLQEHCQKSKSLKIKSNLFAKTPKTLGCCGDRGSWGGMVGCSGWDTPKLKCETHAKWHEDGDESTKCGSYK